MEDTAFPSGAPAPRRQSFQMTAKSMVPPALEDAALLKTLVSAADEHTIKEAIPDEPFLSVETKTILAALLAEFLGTLFLMLVSVGIQANEIDWSTDSAASVDASGRLAPDMTLTIAVTTGLTYMCLISTFQRVSGGHFNPAITVAAMVSRRIGILPSVLYIIVQIAAGIAGVAIYDGMSGNDNYGELALNKIDNDFDTGSIFGVELMATMWVTLIWFFSLDLGVAPCGRHREEMGPMYVGFAYTLAIALTVRWDRGGINPARSFGPAVLTNSWDQHWVYWMGPLIGAMSGALIFELFLWLSPGVRSEQKQAF